MKLEHSFEVAAPLERVWQKLIDVEQVAPCLPGAEVTEAGEDGTYHGTCSVRYYADAMREVVRRVGEVQCFVFSDDPAWCLPSRDASTVCRQCSTSNTVQSTTRPARSAG